MASEEGREGWSSAAGAVIPLVVFGGVLAWWGGKSGGYFEVTFLPGTMILLGWWRRSSSSRLPPAPCGGPPWSASPPWWASTAWTLISGIWSSVPAVAFSDSQRVLGYAAAFVVGAWSCLLLGRRMLLALSPLALAGTVVALVTLIVLWTGSNSHDFFETDATLRYPIGYRNAEAAFFLMAMLPAIVLCVSRDLPGASRGPARVLDADDRARDPGQSRASMPGRSSAVAVLIGVASRQAEVLGWLTLAAIPAVIVLPWLLDPFQLEPAEARPRSPRSTGRASRWRSHSTLASAVGLVGGALRLGPRVARAGPVGHQPCTPGGGRLIILVGLVALFRSDGGPGGFVDQRVGPAHRGDPRPGQPGQPLRPQRELGPGRVLARRAR